MSSANPIMRNYLAVFVSLLIVSGSRAATIEPAVANGAESLGERLLDDLAPNQSAPRSKASMEQQPKKPAAPATNSFGVGGNPAAQPLVRVQHGMQNAEALLAQPSSNPNTSAVQLAGDVQRQILSNLDTLIAQLSKQCQCQGGQCQGGERQGDKPCDKPGQNSQTKVGKPGSASGRGQTAARDSTDRLDRTTAKPVDKGNVEEIVKGLWGQLPARSREQMLQSFSDEFLPKYEMEIEQYYRRLNDEHGKADAK